MPACGIVKFTLKQTITRRRIVETRKIDVLFGLAVIGFLVVTIILIKDFNYERSNDLKEYQATLTNIVMQKNNKIKLLANRLMMEQKENEDLKNTLSETRNDLEALSKKLAQPAPVAVSAPVVSAPAVSAPAVSAPVATAVTK